MFVIDFFIFENVNILKKWEDIFSVFICFSFIFNDVCFCCLDLEEYFSFFSFSFCCCNITICLIIDIEMWSDFLHVKTDRFIFLYYTENKSMF